jgi:hypothetical protein
MDLSDSPSGPIYPSRVSGWVAHPPLGVSRVASDLLVRTCRRHYPGGTMAGIVSLPCQPWLRPSPLVGRVGSHISIFEACSAFTQLRPACSRDRHAVLSIEGFGDFVASTAAPIATGWSESCRVGIAPTEDRRLFTAHQPIMQRIFRCSHHTATNDCNQYPHETEKRFAAMKRNPNE